MWGVIALGAVAISGPGRAASAAVASSDDASAEVGLEEVIVTAEKESASLQKTAAAITAISGDSLIASGITDLRAAQMVVPAVRFQVEGNSTQVFVRGVGSNLDLAPVEQTVAFNLNGTYVPREGTSSAFFDLASMEVLPGPQGTLYGRSAVGGTVNVNFVRPSNDWSGNAEVEVGNYSLFHVSAAQNLPVTSTLSLRVAVNYTDRSGYEDSGADSQNDPSARLSLLFTPTDNFSAYLWSSDARKFGHPPNLVNKGYDPTTGEFSADTFLTSNPWNDLRYGSLTAFVLPYGQATAEKQDYQNFSNGGQIDWKLGSVTLTYIPSYIHLLSGSYYWLGAIPAYIYERYNMSSNELRLSNDKGGAFDWLLGLYQYHQHNQGYFLVADVAVNSDVRDNLIEGEAVYGQVTYHVTDQLRLTGGARYSADKREAYGFQTAAVTATGPGAPEGLFIFDKSYNNADWKTAVEYDIAKEVMGYAAVQTAYEPGTYNSAPSTPTFDDAVKPTHLTAYTAGLKSRYLDDTLQINPEMFYYDYRNFIEQQYDIHLNFNPVFNAQKIRIYGTQVDLLWKPTRIDTVNMNLAYTHARNTEFTTPAGQNYNGLQPPYSPDWTIIGGYSHEFPLPHGDLRARIDGRYESGWWADYVHNPGVDQPASVKEDASFTYEADQHWSVGIWGKNLSNRAVIAATAAAGFPGPATAYLEAPRTFGLRATLAW